MISWPDEVITSLARRRAVLFLGAGVSMHSRNAYGVAPPSWKTFLQRGIEQLGGSQKELNKLLNSGDYLSCCHIIKNKLGAEWIPFLEKCFVDPKYSPAPIHSELFRLDSSIVMTPNFDKIYDLYATSQTQNRLITKMYYDSDIPRVLRGNGEQRLILKIHCCIDAPDRLVFTREDYSNVRSNFGNFYRAVDALIMTHTFIFIGCGLNDPDLALILEQYARSFGWAPPHYVLMAGRKSSEYKNMLESNYNIKLIEYSSADDHCELVESLRALAEQVDSKRDQLRQTRLW